MAERDGADPLAPATQFTSLSTGPIDPKPDENVDFDEQIDCVDNLMDLDVRKGRMDGGPLEMGPSSEQAPSQTEKIENPPVEKSGNNSTGNLNSKKTTLNPLALYLEGKTIPSVEHLFGTWQPEDAKKFFDENRGLFYCSLCNAPYNGDGKAKGSYRLKCSDCNKTISFTKALQAVREFMASYYAKNILKSEHVELGKRTRAEDETQPSEEFHEAQETAEPAYEVSMKLDMTTEFEKLKKENEALRRELNESRTTNVAVQQNLRAVSRMNEELSSRLNKLEQDNIALLALLDPSKKNVDLTNSSTIGNSTTKTTSLDTSNSVIDLKLDTRIEPKKSPIAISYKTLAAINRPVRPQPASNQARALSKEQLERKMMGLPANPPKTIKAIHVVGFKAQKISTVKELLRDQFGVSLRNIMHIDFIGKSLMEIHIFEDYLAIFKERLLNRVSTVQFLDIDPLSPELLRYNTASNKSLEAAKLYLRRLTKRLETTPSAAHKRFLSNEIARCNSAIPPVDGSSMIVESTSSNPTNNEQC